MTNDIKKVVEETDLRGMVMDDTNNDPVAWLVRYKIDGEERTAVCKHNSVGDYRHLDPDAQSEGLYRANQNEANR